MKFRLFARPTTVTSKPSVSRWARWSRNCCNKRRANIPDADQNKGQTFTSFEKRLMNNIERAGLLRCVNHTRDIALGSPLRDRRYVDIMTAKRAEHFP